MKELFETQKVEYKNAKNCHICERKLVDTPPSVEKTIRVMNKEISITRGILSKLENIEGHKFSEIANNKK